MSSLNGFVLDSIRAHLDAVLDQIERLEGSEFPYEDSRQALTEMRVGFEERRSSLSGLLSDGYAATSGPIDVLCGEIQSKIANSLEILGFILRSTNVRNAFEICGPLRRLAQSILNHETKSKMPADWGLQDPANSTSECEPVRLLISSEWTYTPFTYLRHRDLPGFVLIGLPATESSNPLLVPAAGHELGHTIWRDFRCDRHIRPIISKTIVDDIRGRWNQYSSLFPSLDLSQSEDDVILKQAPCDLAWGWAMCQSEEVFCDFVGLRIFGESYLHSFAYLVAPWRAIKRSYEYPSRADRATSLVATAAEYDLMCPSNYTGMFTDPDETDSEIRPWLLLADKARQEARRKLAEMADLIVTTAGLTARSPKLVEECKQVLRLSAPARNAGGATTGLVGLANILNAAWGAFLDRNFFAEAAYNGPKREAHLKEIVLKSIEVLEIELMMKEAT